MQPFQTPSSRMSPALVVSFQTPVQDVGRIMAAVAALTALAIGDYDNCAFVAAPGTERYRPRPGAASGAEEHLRERPGVVEVSFELPDEPDLAARVVEAIFQSHAYQEPVIRLWPTLSSRSKGLDDRANPNRWWNTTGDWKTA